MSAFDQLRDKLEDEGHSAESATKIAAAIGDKKYGTEGMAQKAADARKHAESDSPVPRLATVKGVELFDEGLHKGQEYGPEYIDQAIANFHRLSAGDKPLLTVPVVLGHEEDQSILDNTGYPAAGRLVNVYRDGTKLAGDFADVPEKVAHLINQKAYRKVSAEFYDNFADQGQSYGPTIRRIALLGGEVPQVKSLDDIPMAQFCERLAKRKHRLPTQIVGAGYRRSFHNQTVTIFSELKPMDRAQMLAALQQMGFNTSIITDAVPDEIIAELLAALQAGSNQATPGSASVTPADQNPPPANSQMSDDDDATQTPLGPQMADNGAPLNPAAAPPANQSSPAPMFSQGDPGSTTPGPANPSSGISAGSPGASTVPSPIPSGPTQHPSQVIMKYSEDIRRIVSEQVGGVLKQIDSRLKAAEQQSAARLANEKRANIEAFCERMVREGKILPSQLDRGDPKNPRVTLKDTLMAADANRVVKFGEKSMSQLDMLMQVIENGPKVSRFSEVFADPVAKAGQLEEDRRKELLNKTVIGRKCAERIAKK